MTFFSAIVRPGFLVPLAALKSAPPEALLEGLVRPSDLRGLRTVIAALEKEGFVGIARRGSREYVIKIRPFPPWVTGLAGHYGVFDLPHAWRVDSEELTRFGFVHAIRPFEVLNVAHRRTGRRRTPAVYLKHMPAAGDEHWDDLLVALLHRDGRVAALLAQSLDPERYPRARERIRSEQLYYRARYFGIVRRLGMRAPRKRRTVRRDAQRRSDFADD